MDAFGENQWPAMEAIINRESGFNPYAVNKSSGACGLLQANPCSKLPCTLDNIVCQANWGVDYVRNRYETPVSALSFWNLHHYY